MPDQTNPTLHDINSILHTHKKKPQKFPSLARTGSFVARAIILLLGSRVDLPADWQLRGVSHHLNDGSWWLPGPNQPLLSAREKARMFPSWGLNLQAFHTALLFKGSSQESPDIALNQLSPDSTCFYCHLQKERIPLGLEGCDLGQFCRSVKPDGWFGRTKEILWSWAGGKSPTAWNCTFNIQLFCIKYCPLLKFSLQVQGTLR